VGPLFISSKDVPPPKALFYLFLAKLYDRGGDGGYDPLSNNRLNIRMSIRAYIVIIMIIYICFTGFPSLGAV
jgi:hypothetical protein